MRTRTQIHAAGSAELPYNDWMTNHRAGWVAHKNLHARAEATLPFFLFSSCGWHNSKFLPVLLES